jgi:hypothetical protein
MKSAPMFPIQIASVIVPMSAGVQLALGSQSPPNLVAHWDFEIFEADGRTLRSRAGTYSGRVQDNPILTAIGGGRPGGGRGASVQFTGAMDLGLDGFFENMNAIPHACIAKP